MRDLARVGATRGPAWRLFPAPTMNGSVVVGLGGSRHLRPGGPSALALGPPSVPALQAPRQCPGKGGQLTGAYCGLCRMLQGLFPVGVTLRGQLLTKCFLKGFPFPHLIKQGSCLSLRDSSGDPARVGSSQLVLTVLVGCVFRDVRGKGTRWSLACTVNHRRSPTPGFQTIEYRRAMSPNL